MGIQIGINLKIHKRSFIVRLVAAFLLLLASLSIYAAGTPSPPGRMADVYIFAGQSNALGKKLSPTELKKEFYANKYFSDFSSKAAGSRGSSKTSDGANIAFAYHLGTVSHRSPNGIVNEVSSAATDIDIPLSPAQWSDNSFRFGPELSFAKKLHDTMRSNPTKDGHKIMLIKVAFGASSLQMHWLDGRKYRLLDKLETKIESVAQNLKASGYTVNVKAFFWIQGEADIGRGNAGYFRNLKTVLAGVRNSVKIATGSDAFPLVIARTAMVWRKEKNSCLVRCAQQDFASEDMLGSIVDIDDLSKKDCFHYASDAYITIGERLYDAFIMRKSRLSDPFCDCKQDTYTGKPVIQPMHCSR